MLVTGLLSDSSTPPIFSQFQPGSPIVDLTLRVFSGEIIFPCLAVTGYLLSSPNQDSLWPVCIKISFAWLCHAVETQVTLRDIKSLPKEDFAMGSPLCVSLSVSLSLSLFLLSLSICFSLCVCLCLCVCLYFSTTVGTPGIVLEAPSHLRRAEK